jgi:hypothetical protein
MNDMAVVPVRIVIRGQEIELTPEEGKYFRDCLLQLFPLERPKKSKKYGLPDYKYPPIYNPGTTGTAKPLPPLPEVTCGG